MYLLLLAGRVQEVSCPLTKHSSESDKAFRSNVSKQIRGNKQHKAAERKRIGHQALKDPPKIVVCIHA